MMKTEKQKFKNFNYIFQTPDNYCAHKKYPAIIFLHGAGSRGNDIDTLRGNPYFAETKKNEYNVITFAPQCFADTWFDILEQLKEFTDYVINEDFVDKDRVYLMGASMGGYATWQLAMSMPNVFAAIVPICGGGMYWNADRLKAVPVWAFHGSEDPVVYPEESKKMVDAVNKNGGNAKLTICEGVGHNSWLNAYRSKEVFQWMLSHEKNSLNESSNRFDDQNIYG
ncbi:MAG: prolyl oligopeptidase family serine peptidase [Bacillota bacterium]|nr:prolyl oligopeptidase family serine peptidase [Bacillota bacterium]